MNLMALRAYTSVSQQETSLIRDRNYFGLPRAYSAIVQPWPVLYTWRLIWIGFRTC